MAGLISEVIDGKVEPGVERLIQQLVSVEKQLDTINSKSITLNMESKGVDSMSAYTNMIKQQDEIIKELTANTQQYKTASVQYSDAMAKSSAIIAQYNGHSKEYVAVLKGVEQAQNTATKSTVEAAKASTELSKQKLIELKYTQELTKEKERVEKLAAKEQANLEKQKGAYAQLSAEYNKAAKEAQNLGAQQEIINRQIIANPANKAQLLQQYQALSPALKSAQINADGLHKSLLSIDQAVGKSQRNVGNYASATFAMSQILREAPSFAYSFSTGLMGISNNIPILVDEITKLKVANEALKESGQTTIPIWKTLGAAFLSPVGIITTLTAVITIFAARMTMAGNETKNATDRLKEFNDAFKQNQSNMLDSVSKSLSEIFGAQQDYELQKNIMLDQNKSIDERFNAYSKMLSIAPKVLDDMDKNTFATKMNSEAMKAASENGTKFIEVQKRLAEAQKSRDDQQKLSINNSEQQNTLMESLRDYYGNDVSQSTIDRIVSKSGNKHAPMEDSHTKEAVELNILKDKQKIIQANLKTDLDNVDRLTRELSGMEGKTKDKAGKKDNAKELEAELKAEQEHFKIRQELDQREYDLSAKTFTDELIFDERKKEAAKEHATEMLSIIEKYHGKVGESEAKYTERKAQAIADQLAIDNAANEDETQIAIEIQKRHIQAEKDMDELIKKLSEQRQKMRDLQRAIDEIHAASTAHSERAGGVSPFLQALGFDADFQESQNTIDRQIAIAKEKRADLMDARGNAFATGSGLAVGQADIAIGENAQSIADLEAKKQKAIDDKIIQAKKEAADKTIELVKTTFDSIKQIQENQFAWEQQQIQIKMESVRMQSQQQIQAIDATAGFQITKDNQKAKVAAQTAAEENALQAKSNELKLKQARWEKQNAEMTIIANTATAIIKTIAAYAGIPGGILIAAPIIALEAAIGAAQYAAAASAPLPQFAGGTEKGTWTKHFIAGEKGAEMGVTPSGETMMFNKPGIYTAPLGTKIKTADETKRLIQYAINGIGFNNQSISGLQEKRESAMTDKRIVAEIKELRQDVITAAMLGRVKFPTEISAVIKSNDLQRPKR